MAMVTTLFFMWGFLTSLNDILVPHLKAIFELNYTKVMLINSAFFGSYFLFAVPAGKLIEKIGYKRTWWSDCWSWRSELCCLCRLRMCLRLACFSVP